MRLKKQKKGLITLEAFPDAAVLRKKLHLSQQQYANTYCIKTEK
jgi:hypothetical protein